MPTQIVQVDKLTDQDPRIRATTSWHLLTLKTYSRMCLPETSDTRLIAYHPKLFNGTFQKERLVTILEVGAEGGSITLNGEQSESGDWAFWVVTDESMLYEEFDEESGAAAAPRKTNRVASFSAAVKLLDIYCWFRLYPLKCIQPSGMPSCLRSESEERRRMKLSGSSESRKIGLARRWLMLSMRLCAAFAGMLVELTTKPEWGPGKIGHVDGDKLHIIFRTVRTERQRSSSRARQQCEKLPSRAIPYWNLPPLKQTEHGCQLPRAPISFERAKGKFLHHFPGGFSDLHYLSDERQYKMTAHQKFQRELGIKEVREMLASGAISTIISRGSSILDLVGSLIAPFETLAFNDAMRDVGAAHAFYAALFQLLEAPSVNETVFDPYAEAVMSLPALRVPQ